MASDEILVLGGGLPLCRLLPAWKEVQSAPRGSSSSVWVLVVPMQGG